MMQLQLSEHEAQLLGQVLESYMKDLRSEIVDTDNAAFRRELREERDALMAIAQRLQAHHSASPETIARMVKVTAVLTEYD